MKYTIKIIISVLLFLGFSGNIFADTKFQSNYSCSDSGKRCLSKGTRKIDGFEVSRDCWEWSYVKTCSYPSRNDCVQWEQRGCYLVQDRDCLLRDSIGNCVNLKKEFSCQQWYPIMQESQTTRVGLEEKEGKEGLICKGVPCIDGNCFDKSYMTNGEIMDSLSKLSTISSMKGGGNPNIKLFEGSHMYCSKKAGEYCNCCRLDSAKGWGNNIGAGCNEDERLLMQKRQKNLCVYVGETESSRIGVTTVKKHHYCCFGNLIDKAVQVGARSQKGMRFGSESSPDCGGLSIELLTGYNSNGQKVGEGVDFNRIDFSEFIEDLKVKFAGDKGKSPSNQTLGSKVQNSMSSIRKYDGDPVNPDNNKTGVNMNIKDDSWEAQRGY